jgi:hypothetical protein
MLKRPTTDRIYNFLHNTRHMLKICHFCTWGLLMNDTVAYLSHGWSVICGD